MKRYIIVILLINTFSVFSQDLKKQFGLNIASDVALSGAWRMGLQLSYTNQRHFLSIGMKNKYHTSSKYIFSL